ncbi:MAG TPA: dihydrolipoamide acetyltransferase family protein [Glaciibacter sp.]|nr:dihydrolipoamide acetyltransferase family protein [Glaciibacter sp.]
MTRHDFLLPDLGEGLTEAAIVNWLVSPGDTITIDQPVVEVESAKSVVELPSPFGGVVESVCGGVGDVIHAGSVLLTVADGADSAGSAGTAGSADAEAASIARGTAPRGSARGAAQAAAPAGSGAVLVGYGTTEGSGPVRRPATSRFGAKRTGVASSAPASVAVLDPARRSPVVSPLVRRLAKEHGFDATQLAGTGRDSLVLRSDVESFIQNREGTPAPAPTQDAPELAASGAPAASPPATPPAPAMTTPAAPAGLPAATSAPSAAEIHDTRIPITGLRKAVAQRMTVSRREIPEATIWMDVDATELFRARDALLAATGERFSVTALIARFVVAGLRQFPLLNSAVDTASQEILQYGAIHLGIAAQTPRGLMVPVVHDAHAMSTRQLRDAIAGLVTQSADGSFPPSALTGGTFTLNNFGALGVDGSAAIINHPEAAILGIGRMIERPWVVNHELAVRTVVELSMVFDHRVCDGGTAAGFLTFIARCIESPVALLADL